LSLEDFARRVGLDRISPSLLQRALTHRSYINEHPDAIEDNERLEFLGDAALDFIAATWLYHRFPEMDEGGLTRLRSSLVRTEQLADFARELDLGEGLRLGRGEEVSGGREREALLCDAFEAVVGAIYLDAGLDETVHFLEPRLLKAANIALEDDSLIDPRSQLQIWAQAEMGVTPQYETVDSSGPDHQREFVVEVRVGEELKGVGQGRSKQEAAHEAAKNLLSKIS
jgi:ribonuclease-3